MNKLEESITKDFTLDHAFSTLESILNETKEVTPKYNSNEADILFYVRHELYMALTHIDKARKELRK